MTRGARLFVIALLALDVLLGASLSAFGFFVLASDAITLAGALCATIGLLLILGFQFVWQETGHETGHETGAEK